MEDDKNHHDLTTRHGKFAVPPFLWSPFFQEMAFKYDVVFFEEFVDEIVDLYSLIGENHCLVCSFFSAH